MTDPRTRFDSHATAYAAGRPRYPRGAAELVAGLGRDVADVGAGTGLYTEALLAAGAHVVAVEPSEKMRAELRARLPELEILPGGAEDTGLDDASVDVVVAAQAAHWFDVERSLVEWRRILRPGGHAALLWNTRRTDDPFGADLDATLRRYAEGRSALDYVDEKRGPLVARFLGPDFAHAAFDNPHPLDAAGFAAYVGSVSYLPKPGTARRAEALAALDDVFARHARDGRAVVPHVCDVYYAALAARSS